MYPALCGDHPKGPVRLPLSRWPRQTDILMSRHQFFHDPAAPRADDLLPAAYAATRNPRGQVLLVCRADDHNWELPGGRIDVGESASQAVIREVNEETGIAIALVGLSGVYSDPGHVLQYSDQSVHQQVAICFHAVADGDAPYPDQRETIGAAWYELSDTGSLPMHPTMRQRLSDALSLPRGVYFD